MFSTIICNSRTKSPYENIVKIANEKPNDQIFNLYFIGNTIISYFVWLVLMQTIDIVRAHPHTHTLSLFFFINYSDYCILSSSSWLLGEKNDEFSSISNI